MNGAHSLLATLRANEVTTIFTNPGTTEVDLMAALDSFDDVHAVLCLFEGVATGAADGFARVTGRASATLVHLGPGLSNGWANLHNARRAHSPIVNIVGDHPDAHRLLDPPLNSDLEGLTQSLGGWFRRIVDADDVADLTAGAVGACYGPPGRSSTLLLPSNVAWSDVAAPPHWPVARRETAPAPSSQDVVHAARSLRTRRSAIFIGGDAVSGAQLALAQRVCAATSSRLIMETFPAIFEHGAGIVSPERLIYLSDFALGQLSDLEVIVLIGATVPAPPFAYRRGPDQIVAQGCDVIDLAPPGVDTFAALDSLVNELDAPPVSIPSGSPAEVPPGPLDSHALALAIASTIPEGLIISDESNTSGLHLYGATQWSNRHRVMTLTGNAIGFGLPATLGAASAKQGRVLAIEADGSMMYTLQALWTMAHEGLDVTVLALSNRSYAIVELELRRVHQPLERSSSQLLVDLDDPALDLAGIARGLGVPSVRVETTQELLDALLRSYSTPGPMFIEAILPHGIG
ncbi:MAG: acetolactate synthase large subunit [Acidimicrobiaceae bacterium]|nr:acetolactate synthase large subunit [Acidimicrobiaceae bacterium]